MSKPPVTWSGVGVSAASAAKALRAFAGVGISVCPPASFFKVTRRRDDFLVEWRFDLAQDKEVYRWFMERGHQARFIDGMRSKGRYVKCSKELAVMAKLTWGGA
jgi:hypothetical protein